MTLLILALASCTGCFLSTLAGGGSPLILIPVLGIFLDSSLVPPVLTVGMFIGNSQRTYLYWNNIDWTLTKWYLPGAIVGSVIGAFIFTKIQFEWLSLVFGILLILSTLSYIGKGTKPSFEVQAWHFLPAGMIYAFLSGLVGSMGPILNPFYLNYGLDKEDLLATKAFHMIIVHFVKIIAYIAFGVMTRPTWGYGILLGLAALPGNWFGQKILNQMSTQQFRQMVMSFVGVSGMILVWEQRHIFLP